MPQLRARDSPKERNSRQFNAIKFGKLGRLVTAREAAALV
jgi:hypothetical protein